MAAPVLQRNQVVAVMSMTVVPNQITGIPRTLITMAEVRRQVATVVRVASAGAGGYQRQRNDDRRDDRRPGGGSGYRGRSNHGLAIHNKMVSLELVEVAIQVAFTSETMKTLIIHTIKMAMAAVVVAVMLFQQRLTLRFSWRWWRQLQRSARF
ncbi:hypothetical protein EVAR_71425_1 [Eumeta japonica]|uniref:Uncharacterized protein n=1 Tax=Eumeta variegata TaxID=151549 RepID=A0A4C1SY06_EUMVA|nr:hypothetical protein EVAR_71425_1 [Eumeta japonica]